MSRPWQCHRDESHPVAPHPIFGWPQCQVDGAAPPYHDRGKYLPEGFTLDVVVPNDRARIHPGSAVVGVPTEGGVLWTLSFEGGSFDRNARWDEWLIHAADRMVTQYPTTARTALPGPDLTVVGTYDPRTNTFYPDPSAADLLANYRAAWRPRE